ncbi:hypothetical protein AC241_27320 (plasmid) [Bacillus thuringiensis]|uniref:restriction endonuclease subunit S n=1 Tax=Bacillus thuringiensis TaxID=1428 RepID=UPI000676BB91|nr:restriction endonuclease subunit S [Bacillus thuringiensis]AKR12472.1 hypothetical protein AC241_27320 [Bacillus thuringiensis]
MGFIEYKLSELGEIITGKTPPKTNAENYNSKDVLFIKPDDISVEKINRISKGKSYVSEKGAETGRLVGKGTILVTCIGIVGKIGIVECERAIFNQQINAIIPNEKIVLGKYLAYLLNSMQRQLQDKANAPIVPILNKTNFSKIKVRIPSLTYQEKVIDLLDGSQTLIQKRQFQITALDELTQSVFLEMFGDPLHNPKRWKKGKIADLTETTQYGTSSKANEGVGEFPILRMNNITYKGGWDFSNLKYIDLDEKEQKKYLVHKGDLLFNRTNSKELVGKTAVYRNDIPYAYAGYLVKLIPNAEANAEFISAYLNSEYGKRILLNKAKSIVGMANINAQELKSIDIYLPPKKSQDDYAYKIQSILKYQEQLKDSLESYNNLYNSLLQRAFKGELFQEQV